MPRAVRGSQHVSWSSVVQGEVAQSQVLRRVTESWGERSTLHRAVQRMSRNWVEWGVLSETGVPAAPLALALLAPRALTTLLAPRALIALLAPRALIALSTSLALLTLHTLAHDHIDRTARTVHTARGM